MSKLGWSNPHSPMDMWVEERHKDYYGTRFRCKKVLFSGKSDYQYIDVVETASHGRMLLNDGIVMFSDRDEFIYHEMMAHVPLFTHPLPKRVLIIGGGDGGVAREVLRHKSVDQCVLVEIDKMVVEVSKKYFPKISCSFKNPKLQLKIEDGVLFVKEVSQNFDVILVDSTDPFGPAKDLFSEVFYKNVHQLLSEEGLLVVQAESPFFEIPTQKFILQSLKKIFPLTTLYNYSNTVYPGGLWSFVFASKKHHPIKNFRKNKLKQIAWNLSYYNEDIHKAAFAQPSFVKKELKNII
ncbi:MAG: polyamine aminopropyltransferase [Bdellovibrionales bacterium]|nr:polyamine aminopropyltransferase [Bdellovibrionales bacterium]